MKVHKKGRRRQGIDLGKGSVYIFFKVRHLRRRCTITQEKISLFLDMNWWGMRETTHLQILQKQRYAFDLSSDISWVMLCRINHCLWCILTNRIWGFVWDWQTPTIQEFLVLISFDRYGLQIFPCGIWRRVIHISFEKPGNSLEQNWGSKPTSF